MSTHRGLCFHICSDRLAEQEAYDIDVSTEGCQLQRGDTFGRAALHIRAYIWAEKHTERLKFSRLGGPMKRCAACSWAIGDNSGAREGREGGRGRERERSSAAIPFSFVALTSAPRLASSRKTSCIAASATECNAVAPFLSLCSRPPAARARTASTWPAKAARCSAVRPSPSDPDMSDDVAPPASIFWMAGVSPTRAARRSCPETGFLGGAREGGDLAEPADPGRAGGARAGGE